MLRSDGSRSNRCRGPGGGAECPRCWRRGRRVKDRLGHRPENRWRRGAEFPRHRGVKPSCCGRTEFSGGRRVESFCSRRMEFPGWRRPDLTPGGYRQFPAGCGLEMSRRNNVWGVDCPLRRWLNASGRRFGHSFRTPGGDFRFGQRPELRSGLHALRSFHLALHMNLLAHRGGQGLGGLAG